METTEGEARGKAKVEAREERGRYKLMSKSDGDGATKDRDGSKTVKPRPGKGGEKKAGAKTGASSQDGTRQSRQIEGRHSRDVGEEEDQTRRAPRATGAARVK